MKTPFTATKSVCLVLLGTLGLLPLSAFGQVYQACSFGGIGVYNAPPTGVCGEDGVVSFAPPSEVSACLDSFYLDPTNATQYLESLIKLTQDYYIFNDIAINPTASVPAVTPVRRRLQDLILDSRLSAVTALYIGSLFIGFPLLLLRLTLSLPTHSLFFVLRCIDSSISPFMIFALISLPT